MSLVADSELAMVLPIPVPPSSAEDAVRFVDMSSCPTFFHDVDFLFPEEVSRGGYGGPVLSGFAPPAALVVHDVGDFEASFVPAQRDFDRLDRRFRLPAKVWDALPAYRDWGFCVFKLRAAIAATDASRAATKPGLIDRISGVFGRPAAPAAAASRRDYHPMAFEFPLRDGARTFFPTVHVHDGKVADTAVFDHSLYYQGATPPSAEEAERAGGSGTTWRRSSLPAAAVRNDALAWLDPQLHVHRLKLAGDLPNRDLFV